MRARLCGVIEYIGHKYRFSYTRMPVLYKYSGTLFIFTSILFACCSLVVIFPRTLDGIHMNFTK